MAGYQNSVPVQNTAARPVPVQEEEKQINLKVVAYDVIRNWWVILLTCLIAVFSSYVFLSELYVPVYTASTTFVVISRDGGTVQLYNPSQVTSDIRTSSSLADSFTYVLESQALKKKVADSLGYQTFSGSVLATSVENTNIIQVSVTAGSPQIAFDEMNGIINYNDAFLSSLLGNATLEVLQAPAIPTSPSNSTSRLRTVALIALGTAALIIAIIVVMSVMSDQIMTEEDLAKKVDCPELATVNHEKKNQSLRSRLRGEKTSMIITNPTTSFRFAETYRLYRTRLEYIMKQKGYKVLMVSSVYENEGKTTAAVNTALTLAISDKKVLLIDGDMLKPSLYKVLDTKVDKGMAIEEVVATDVPFQDLPTFEGLPTLSLLLGKNVISKSTDIIGSNEMKDFLTKAKAYYDYIVIDTPPIALASDAECFAEVSDCALLVIKQGAARAKRINDCLEAISQSGADIIGCIFNNVREVLRFGTGGAQGYAASDYGGGYGSGYGSGYGTGYGYGGYGYGSGYGSGYGTGYGGYGTGYGRYGARRQAESGTDENAGNAEKK